MWLVLVVKQNSFPHWHTQNSDLKFIDVNLQFAKQRLTWPLSSTVLGVLNPMGEEISSAALTL